MPKWMKTPAVSREYEFCSEYIDEVDAVREDKDRKIAIGEVERQLTKKVYERAERDVRDLLEQVGICVSRAANGIVRLDPQKRQSEDWDVSGRLYKIGGGRPKRLGWFSLFVGYRGSAPGKLLGLVHPVGGRYDELKSFADKSGFKLASAKYGWPKSDDCAIWLDKKLTRRTSLEELRREVEAEAKRAFKKMVPILTRIIEQK